MSSSSWWPSSSLGNSRSPQDPALVGLRQYLFIERGSLARTSPLWWQKKDAARFSSCEGPLSCLSGLLVSLPPLLGCSRWHNHQQHHCYVSLWWAWPRIRSFYFSLEEATFEPSMWVLFGVLFYVILEFSLPGRFYSTHFMITLGVQLQGLISNIILSFS